MKFALVMLCCDETNLPLDGNHVYANFPDESTAYEFAFKLLIDAGESVNKHGDPQTEVAEWADSLGPCGYFHVVSCT